MLCSSNAPSVFKSNTPFAPTRSTLRGQFKSLIRCLQARRHPGGMPRWSAFANSIWMRLVGRVLCGGGCGDSVCAALCCRILERASTDWPSGSRPTSGRAASDLAHPCFPHRSAGSVRRDPSGTHAGRYGVDGKLPSACKRQRPFRLRVERQKIARPSFRLQDS